MNHLGILTPEIVLALRAIKKTAVALLVLYALDAPITISKLAAILEIQPRTAGEWLDDLSFLGLVARTSAGFIITNAGSQLILFEEHARNARTTTTAIDSESIQNLAAVVVSEDTRVSRVSSPEFEANLTALEQYGVGRSSSAAIDLAGQDYVNPDYIHALAEQMGNRKSPALLITKLRSRDPVTAANASRIDSAEDRQRYITDEYSEYVNH